MGKEFFTYDKQIAKLIEDGLIIGSEEESLRILQDVGYYRIINGYNQLFTNKKRLDGSYADHKYKQGVRFEDIQALYDFDFELRNIIYKRTSHAEVRVKAIISYVFSQKYGIDHTKYLDQDSFRNDENYSESVQTLIELCKNTISEAGSSESGNYKVYLAHILEKHGVVPLWSLFMSLTFGSVSKFFQLMKKEERVAVAQLFGVEEHLLINILKVVVKFRNIVSHHERLFNARLFRERLSPRLSVARMLSIPKNQNGINKYGLNDFLSLLIALKYLISGMEYASMIYEIKLALERLSKTINPDYMNAVKREMAISHVNLDVLSKIKLNNGNKSE